MATIHLVRSATARAVYDAYAALVPPGEPLAVARCQSALLLAQLEADPEGMRAVLSAALAVLNTAPVTHDYLNVQMGS